ncbi:MAG: polynucleotide adenylyltransferase PcnB [Gammaproteobacteria bacterium]|nr:polynucleotide adenylyltransferase PcnB [Gammaproteobacteria bacterium]
MISIIKRILGRAPTSGTAPGSGNPVIPREQHSISRSGISESALKVLYRLKGADFEAYLVGGGVRDLLLGREPKDFDIATDATPEQVRKLFRNSRIIGRRFKIVHVRFGREIIEVATFRGHHDQGDGGKLSDEGMILSDNVYGSLEQDAWRRDFTVNALYYNIRDFSVVDYTGGMVDLKNGMLRLIGDTEERLREDPVRMLRAVRFAAKLGFRIDPEVETGIDELGFLLREIPPARLFEEVLKLFLSGHAVASFEGLRHYRLFEHLFPATEDSLAREENGFPIGFILRALENTDIRIAQDRPVTPAFLLAALLWEPIRNLARQEMDAGLPPFQAFHAAADVVLQEQSSHVAIPRRFSVVMREIWVQQSRFERRQGKRAFALLAHDRFRASYDFLQLRAESGEADMQLVEWWTQFQQVKESEQRAMVKALQPEGGGQGRRRRGGRKRSSQTS